jgi:hypothetical protein
MPLYDEKKKEGCAMTPQFPHTTQQEQHRWLWPLIPSILAAGVFISTVDSASLAAAAECQVTEESGAIQGMTAWKGTRSRTLSLINTTERKIFGGFVLPPVREAAPYMNKSPFTWGDAVDQEIAAIGDCVRHDIRQSARFNQSMITPMGKTQARALTQAMKVSVPPYNGKRQVFKMRTTPPEIGVSVHQQAPTIIGPVQEIQKPILFNERSVIQAGAALPSTVEFSSQFGGQPIVALNQFQNALQLPGNESLRMNLMTMQALHEGNCASGCP